MSRDLFLLITSFLHLANKDTVKILDMTLNLNSDLFSSVFNHVSILPTPPSKRAYNPNKSVKYVIKKYMVSDYSNGYISKVKLYTGKFLTDPSFNGAI
jgi:hypothetical protein